MTSPIENSDLKHDKIGVLLVNLGTPDGYDTKNMRRYLKEFLSDRRVIETPLWFWWPLLNGVILNTRPKKSGALYEKIWDRERDESPLRTFTRSQSDLLAQLLSEHDDVVVEWAMRYGSPSIESRLQSLKTKGCERILVFPLYPQYSATTTATVNDKVFEALSKMRWMPSLRVVPPYFDHAAYIDALADSITEHFNKLDFEPQHLLASYHGIPKSYCEKGDPYYDHCVETSRLLEAKMGWKEGFLITTFQSRFGPREWLQPYTDITVEKMPSEGVDRIAIINPGFSSDCLETLEEIAGEVQELFMEAGGKQFSHVPCLNDSKVGMALIESVTRQELMGWVGNSS